MKNKSVIFTVFTVSCSHGVPPNPDPHSVRLASWHLWQEQLLGRGGRGSLKVGLWPHPDEFLGSESKGKYKHAHTQKLLCLRLVFFFFFPFTRHQRIISEIRAIVPCDEAVNCLFQTIPSIAPLNGGRGEMRLALRFLPQITHSEGLPTLLHFDSSIYG